MLVHRRFELMANVTLPRTKAQLLVSTARTRARAFASCAHTLRARTRIQRLLLTARASEFHQYFYGVGHHIPHLREWLAAPENTTATRVVEVRRQTATRLAQPRRLCTGVALHKRRV